MRVGEVEVTITELNVMRGESMPVAHKDSAKIETAKMIVQTLAHKAEKSAEETEAYARALAYLQGHLEGNEIKITKVSGDKVTA